MLYITETPLGTPYAVGMATDSEGRGHTVPAAGEEIDPDHFRLLEGQNLALRVTENGVRVRPIAQQPPAVQDHLIAMLERGEGQVASDAPIPHTRAEAPVEHHDPPQARLSKHGTLLPTMSELATTVAHQAAALGLTTAMWVHLPPQ
ncbi:MAG: hypothetical protein AAFX65_13575 [Cyanobacteria bacterium J06638_7]